jgi:hypothetical protein
MIVLASIFICDTQEPMTRDVGKEIGLPYCHCLVDVRTYPSPMTNNDDLMHFPCILGSSWFMFTSRPTSLYNTSFTYNKITMQDGRYKETHVVTIRKLPKLSMPQKEIAMHYFFTFTTYTFLNSKLFCQTQNTSNIVCMFK